MLPLAVFMFFLYACQTTNKDNNDETKLLPDADSSLVHLDSQVVKKPVVNVDSLLSQPDSAWVDLALLLPEARYDIRYADTLNFMKLKVYECPACFTRLAVAKALMKAAAELDSMGLTFLFFDCYRPSAAQWALWKKMPDARYVHPPTHGSRHSRGVAVDLTIFDPKTNKELDMGTEFDYFGKEAYWNYTKHNEIVTKNRKLLREIMTKHQFVTVLTEWWHFDFRVQKFSLSDMQWPCY